MAKKATPNMLPRNMAAKIVQDEHDCWIFTGATNTKGYGVSAVDGDGSTKLAHRIAYERLVGTIPEGRIVYHTCGIRRCCNPAHLVAAHMKQAMAHVAARRRATKSRLAVDSGHGKLPVDGREVARWRS